MNNDRSLLHRAIKGGAWVFGLRLTQQILALVRLVILARLLSPNDFGLMGVAVLTMSAVETFTQTGFELALIQRKERTEAYLDVVWTVGVIRGAIIFGILQLIAPAAAGFFRSPQAEILIRAIGLSVILRGFQNIGIVYFRKELQFSRQFAYEFAGRLADFIVAVVAAFILRNVWVLLLAFLAGDLMWLVMSYLIHPYRPRFSTELGKAKELFGFGKWILGSDAILFLLNQGDRGFIARAIGTTMLGFYQIASRISNLSATEFALVISQVTIPAYSKLQDDLDKLREAYLRVLQLTAFVSIPVAGIILVLAGDITRIFLGTKWAPAVPAMQVLAAWGAVRSLIATTGPVFVAVGRPRIMTKYQFVQLCLLAGLVYPLTARWGIAGMAGAMLGAGLGSSVLSLNRAKRLTGAHSGRFLRLLLSPLAAAVVAAVPVGLLKATGLPAGLITSFVLAAVCYLLTYLAVAHVVGRRLGYRVGPLVREILAAFRAG